MNQEILVHGRQIAWRVIQGAEHRALEYAQAIVDVAHSRRTPLLVARNNLSVKELHVAGIPLSVVAKDCHQRLLARPQEFILNSLIVARQVGVSVNHKKGVTQFGEGYSKCSGGAERNRSVIGLFNCQSKSSTVADKIADVFTQVTEAQHNTFDTPGFAATAIGVPQKVRPKPIPELWEQSLSAAGGASRDRPRGLRRVTFLILAIRPSRNCQRSAALEIERKRTTPKG